MNHDYIPGSHNKQVKKKLFNPSCQILSFQCVINIKILMCYFTFSPCMKCLKSSVYFMQTAHLSLDLPHFRRPTACGTLSGGTDPGHLQKMFHSQILILCAWESRVNNRSQRRSVSQNVSSVRAEILVSASSWIVSSQSSTRNAVGTLIPKRTKGSSVIVVYLLVIIHCVCQT